MASGRRSSAVETPLPHRKLTPLMLLVAAESFNGTAVFAYVDFGGNIDKEELGYYAGFIASMWFVAQFLSSFFWGRASDIYGHRPILLLGAIGSFISAFLFGLSWSLPTAIIFRSLNGLLNGNIGVVKTAVGRATDSSNQARAFGLISLYGGAGGIAGAGIGGLTARLAVKYPGTFDAEGLWGSFPYLAPNLISCLITIVAIVLAYFYVPRESDEAVQAEEVSISAVEDMLPMPSESLTDSEDNIAASIANASETSNSTTAITLQPVAPFSLMPNHKPLEPALFVSNAATNGDSSFLTLSSIWQRISTSVADVYHKFRAPRQQYMQVGGKPAASDSVFQHRNAVIACFMYAMLGWTHTMFDEVCPLWMLLPVDKDGLGFNTTRIGIVLAFGGATSVCIQLFAFAPAAKKFGTDLLGLRMIQTFQLGLMMAVPVFFLFPFLNLIPRHFPDLSINVTWFFLLLLVILRAAASNLCFSAVMGLIVNSVHRNMMGSANGLGQSLVALLRAIGPVTCGPAFAWSLTAGLPYPLDTHMIWNLLCVALFMNLALSCSLPASVNKPRAEVEQQEIELQAKHEIS